MDVGAFDIASVYGHVVSRDRNNTTGINTLSFLMYPAADIILRNSIVIKIDFSDDYFLRGDVQLFCEQSWIFAQLHPDCELRSDNEIYLPWLKDSKYNLAVWIFALRQFLRRPDVQTWDTQLELLHDFPVVESQPSSCSSAPTTAPQLLCGAGRLKGKRPYMEDVDFQYVNLPSGVGPSSTNLNVYGVMDGHGGKECAIYSGEELPRKLMIEMRQSRTLANPLPQALHRAFHATDTEFLVSSNGDASGSTATVCVWVEDGGVCTVAHVGDTRAVLCRWVDPTCDIPEPSFISRTNNCNHKNKNTVVNTSTGLAVDLTVDMKASTPAEVARICSVDGCYVVRGRVMGNLAVSRALGDRQLKHPTQPSLICTPNVASFQPYVRGDEFLVVASDGLWDVLSSQEVIGMVRKRLVEGGVLPLHQHQPESSGDQVPPPAKDIQLLLDAICNDMVNLACYSLNSLDNITMMILLFTNHNPDLKGTYSRPSRDDPSKDFLHWNESFKSQQEMLQHVILSEYHNLLSVDAEKHPGNNVADPLEQETCFEFASPVRRQADPPVGVAGQAPTYNHNTTSASRQSDVDDDDMLFLLDDSNF